MNLRRLAAVLLTEARDVMRGIADSLEKTTPVPIPVPKFGDEGVGEIGDEEWDRYLSGKVENVDAEPSQRIHERLMSLPKLGEATELPPNSERTAPTAPAPTPIPKFRDQGAGEIGDEEWDRYLSGEVERLDAETPREMRERLLSMPESCKATQLLRELERMRTDVLHAMNAIEGIPKHAESFAIRLRRMNRQGKIPGTGLYTKAITLKVTRCKLPTRLSMRLASGRIKLDTYIKATILVSEANGCIPRRSEAIRNSGSHSNRY